jgi:Zn-dependent protease with chaperone function
VSPRVPSGTDTRFLLLMTAVLASSIGAFYLAYASIPAKKTLMGTTTACFATFEREIDQVPHDPWGNATVIGPAFNRMTACQQPANQDKAGWILGGIAAECLLAVLLYLRHARSIMRRRRLRPLNGAETSELVKDLNRLAHEIGLRREPDWMLDPYSGTAGAQAFGLPWRHRVSLDAGLIIRHGADPAAARAVVLHELAHIRNHDVGRTYLTIAIWRSFLLVPLPLLIILTIHPGLLATPLRWEPQRDAYGWLLVGANTAAIAVLSIVVYLARNAILRARETNADALAVQQQSGQALRSAVSSLPWPPPGAPSWLRRAAWLGTHPSPAARIGAIDDLSRLARISLWEFAGIGFTANLVTQNLNTIAPGFSRIPESAAALGAVPAGLLITSYLALTVWRVTAARPGYRPGLPIWLAALAAMTAGVAAAVPVPIFAPITGTQFLAPANLALALLAFILGAGALTAWLVSTMTAATDSGTSPRGLRTIVGVAVVIGAALFAVWHLSYHASLFPAVKWGAGPSADVNISWYTEVAKVTATTYAPLLYLTQNSLLIPGVTALWLAPLVLLGRTRPQQHDAGRSPFGRAMLTGAVAGLAALLVAIASVFLAKAELPEALRIPADIPPGRTTNGDTFLIIQSNVREAIFLLATAVAVAVVTARNSRLRPALAALTVTIVALLSGPSRYAVAIVSSCADLTGQADCGLQPIALDVLGGDIQGQLLRGILVAVPAALLGTAIRRRRHPALPQPPAGRSTSVAAGAAVLALAVAAVGAAIGNTLRWIPPPVPATIANSSEPTACVSGTWVVEDVLVEVEIADVGTAQFRSSGSLITYHADRVTYDYTGTTYQPATVNGHRTERTKTGAVTQRFSAAHSVIRSYPDSDSRATGVSIVTVDGAERAAEPNANFVDVTAYTCLSDTMHQSGPHFEETLRRVSY